MKERLAGMGAEPIGPTNEQFIAELKAETERLRSSPRRSAAPK